jgi:hypothetical protein
MVEIFMAPLFIQRIDSYACQTEINFLYKWTEDIDFIQPWMQKLNEGINTTAQQYPFLFYGLRLARLCTYCFSNSFYRSIKRSLYETNG